MIEYHRTIKIAIKPSVTYDEQYKFPEYDATLYLCPACNLKAIDKAGVNSLNILKSRWMRTIAISFVVIILTFAILYAIDANLFSTDTNPVLENVLFVLLGLVVIGGLFACCKEGMVGALDPTSQFFTIFYYPFMCIMTNEQFAQIFVEFNPSIEIQVQSNLSGLPYHYTEDKGNPNSDATNTGSQN